MLMIYTKCSYYQMLLVFSPLVIVATELNSNLICPQFHSLIQTLKTSDVDFCEKITSKSFQVCYTFLHLLCIKGLLKFSWSSTVSFFCHLLMRFQTVEMSTWQWKWYEIFVQFLLDMHQLSSFSDQSVTQLFGVTRRFEGLENVSPLEICKFRICCYSFW